MEMFGYNRILAVGDIHGMYEKLVAVYEKVKFNPKDDLLVFLGDYIDRGPNSVKCLRFLKNLQEEYGGSVVCLMGNHEAMMASWFFREKGSEYIRRMADSWLGNGGMPTIWALDALSGTEKETLVEWVSELPTRYVYENFYFCHAGIRPGVSFERQKDVDLTWSRDNWWKEYTGRHVIVVGHVPVQRLALSEKIRPVFLDKVVFCDTGAFMEGGKLSCADVLSRTVWQA